MTVEQSITELIYKFSGLGEFEKATRLSIRYANAMKALDKSLGLFNERVRTTSTIISMTKEGKLTEGWVRLNGQVVEHNRQLDTTKKTQDRLNKTTRDYIKSWTFMQKLVIASLVSRTIGLTIRSLRDGINVARELSIRIGEIRTISHEAQLTTQGWTESVRQLSDTFGTPILETAEAHYQALSNQIAKGAEVTRFLSESQRLAVITVSSSDAAVQALTAVLNSYSLGAENARYVSDALYRTVEYGRLRLDQIASSIGNVTIVGSQLGISLEEVLASIDTLTIQGLNVSTAMTGMRNVMLKLIRPTDKMAEIFNELGATSGANAVEIYGFTGLLKILAQKAEESGDYMEYLGEAFSRIRATQGIVGLTKSIELMSENVERLTNSSKDADQAFKDISETAGYKVRVELQKIANIFTVDIGQKFVNAIAAINSAIGGFSIAIKSLIISIKLVTPVVAGIITAFAAAKIEAATAALAAFLTASAQAIVPISSATLAVTGLAGAFSTLNIAMFGIGAVAYIVTTQFIDSWSRAHTHVSNLITAETKQYVAAEQEKLNATLEFLSERERFYNKNIAARIGIFKKELAEIRKATNELESLRKSQLSAEEKLREVLLDRAKGYKKVALLQQYLIEDTAKLEKLKQSINTTKEANESEKAVEKLTDSILNYQKQLESLKGTRIVENENRRILQQRAGQLSFGGTVRPYNIKGDLAFQKASKTTESTLKHVIGLLTKEGEVTEEISKEIERQTKIIEAKIESVDFINQKYNSTLANLKAQEKSYDNIKTSLLESVDAIKQGSPEELFVSNVDEYRLSTTVTKMQDILKKGKLTQNDYQDLYKGARTIQDAYHSLLLSGQTFKPGTKELVVKLANMADNLGQLDQNIKTATQDFKELAPLWEELKDASEKQKELSAILDKTEGRTIDVLQSRFNILNQTMTELLEGVKEYKREHGDTEAQVEEIQNLFKTSIENIVVLANSGSSAISSVFATLRSEAQSVINLLDTATSKKAALSKWTGGYIKRFAAGGSVGSDSILARLTPGEVVLDKRTSRQFLPQWVAANSRAVGFNSGGQVVNNNIGDINVSLTGTGYIEPDARTLANAIRREITRKTVRLN